MSRKLSLPIISDKEDPFIRAILASPEDESPRLIYADWLDEQGDDPRGEYLRIGCVLAKMSQDDPQFDELVVRFRELHFQVDRTWRTAVARVEIEACRSQFAFRCPKQWDKLQLSGQEHIRYCSACRKQVFYCDTITKAREHARQGDCVAVDPTLIRSVNDLTRGVSENQEELVLGDWDPDLEENSDESGRKRPWWRFWWLCG